MKFVVNFLHVFYRKYLKGRSGFESLQFRLIENRFGLLQVRKVINKQNLNIKEEPYLFQWHRKKTGACFKIHVIWKLFLSSKLACCIFHRISSIEKIYFIPYFAYKGGGPISTNVPRPFFIYIVGKLEFSIGNDTIST